MLSGDNKSTVDSQSNRQQAGHNPLVQELFDHDEYSEMQYSLLGAPLSAVHVPGSLLAVGIISGCEETMMHCSGDLSVHTE